MIAIVGAGASGTLTAIQLGLQAQSPCRVVVFDPADHLGKGLAYGTRDLTHLLNVPAGKISALPEEPSHFLDWLNHPGNAASLLHGKAFHTDDFAPRAIYGCYLSALLEEVYSRPACQALLDVRTPRVVDFIPTSHGGTIVTSEGDTEDVSHVVLALGNLPPRDPLPSRHPFFRSPCYVPHVWKKGAMDTSPDADVLLIGSGLTAVDVILALEAAGHRGRYIVTSRGGRWPQAHAPGKPHRDFLGDRALPGTLRETVRLVREEITFANSRDNTWRAVVDTLRPYTQDLWKNFPEEERRRFLRHVRPLHFTEDADGVTAILRPRRNHDTIALRVQKVFNCIGPESNFRQHLNDPLLINLLARGVLHPDPLFLGLEATADFEPIGTAMRIFEQISLIGPPLRGMLWETTAIPEIRTQAAQIAEIALERDLMPTWEI